MAGTETASTTIEWAISELLGNPKTMIKVKAELEEVIGSNNKSLIESDIPKLPYLQAVVKETFRLHPPAPLLIPRKVTKDFNFMGYDIARNTQVMVNAWAIGRDPEYWDDSTAFKPERFLGSNVDYRGQHFELLPFGAGRRMCAGLPLADRMLHIILGSLLHHFDWEMYNNEPIDMEETFGITARKLNPLKLVPKTTIYS